jgi:hypothetical protein
MARVVGEATLQPAHRGEPSPGPGLSSQAMGFGAAVPGVGQAVQLGGRRATWATRWRRASGLPSRLWRGGQPCGVRGPGRKRRASCQWVGVWCMQGGYHMTAVGLVLYARVSNALVNARPAISLSLSSLSAVMPAVAFDRMLEGWSSLRTVISEPLSQRQVPARQHSRVAGHPDS